MREASRPARRLASALPWMAAGIGVVLLAGVAALLGQDLQRELDASATRARILAQGTAEAVSRRIEGIDFALTGLAARIDPARLDDPSHVSAIHAALVQAREMSRDTNAFVVLDRAGRLVATSRVPPERTERVSLADRPLFAPIAADPAPRLSISPPYLALVGNVKDRGIIALGRPLLDHDGGFAGVVTAILPTFDGRGLLPPIDPPDQGVVLLLRGDGVALEQRPALSDLPREVDLFALPDALGVAEPAASGLFEAVRAGDGETFLAAWHVADRGRAIVLVGLKRSAVVGTWAHTAVPVGIAGAVLAAALLLLAVRLSRTIVRLDDALADLAVRERETSLIADTLGIGLWVRRGSQARTEYRGAFAERLTGKPLEVLESEPNAWRKYVVHPDDREGLKASYRGTDLTRGWRHEYRVIAADGSVHWVEDRAVQLPDATGDGPVYGAITDVTEIHQARERLSRQERQIADAVRLAGLAFWRLPVGSDLFEWSTESYRQFGLDPLGFEPRLDAVLPMIEPEDRPRVAEALRRVRETGESESYVYRFRRADGALRVRWSLTGVERDEGGRVVALAGVSQDITDRERMHAALTQQQLQLAEAGRVAGLGFWRLRKGAQVLDWTDAVYAQMGETRASFVPTLDALYERILPEDREATRAAAERVWETGEPGSAVYRIRRPDGAVRVRWVSMALERGSDGAPVAISGVSQDITEQRLATELLARQERQIAEAGRIARIGFYRRDLVTGAIDCTAEFLAQHGLRPDTPLDLEVFRRLVHPDDRAAQDAVRQRVIDEGETVTFTYRITRPDGALRRLRATIGLERTEDGSPAAISGLFQDVTEEVEAREQLERQQQFLEAARRIGRLNYWRLPLDGEEYTWTDTLFAEYGVDPASFVPTRPRVFAMIHPDDRGTVIENGQHVRRTGESRTTTFRIIRPDGTTRWRRTVVGLERNSEGVGVALIGVTQDVTEEVEAREQIAEQARRLREVGRVAHIGFYRRALDGTQMVATEEKLRQFGLPPDSGTLDVGAFRALMHPDDLPRVEATGRRIVETGESETITFRVCRPDGTVRWVRIVAGLERDADGRKLAVTGLSQDVTEEVEAAEQLRQRDKLLADAGRVARLGFWRRRLDEETVVWSDEVYRFYGFEPGAIVPTLTLIRERMHPDDVPVWQQARTRLLETGEHQTVTVRVRQADGGYRWIRDSVGMERAGDGVVTLYGIGQDVTAEIEASERLRRQDRLLADAGRVARLGFWGRRLDSEVITWTDEVYRHFGVEPGSVAPTNAVIAERLHPDDLAVWNASRARLSETGEAQTIVVRVRHADGRYRWIRNASGIERGGDGVGAVFGITQDVTEEVEARERLDHQRRQLAEAGRVAGLGFWRLPIGGDAFELSEAIYDQIGADPKSFTSSVESVLALMPAEDQAVVRATLDRVAATGEQASVVYRIRRADGAMRHRSSTVGLERAADGRPVALVGVSTDITERVEQEERLERAQRLNALGELTGGIAHDVNNLLSVIGLNLELVHELVPGGEARELTEAALHAVGQGAKLTRGLLAFAQRQSLRPAPVPLAPLIGGLDALLRRALGGRIVLRTDVAPDTPPALVDAAHLETSLVNLVLNARDAMPKGGQVTIRAARASREEAAAAGLAERTHVRIAVEDEGVGMAPEVLARAFEPFFTTKGAGKGTGLGLAMVYGFARQSGGEVRIDSTEGAGTTVTLWLPIAEEEAGARELRPADHAVLAGAHLLVVEDEAPLRALVERLCREAGMVVNAVADAEAALALLRYGVRVDLLLSDIRMPGRLDGHALAAETHALRPGLPVVLMTGFDDSLAGEAVEPQLRKPFSRAELFDALAAALRVPQSAAQ